MKVFLVLAVAIALASGESTSNVLNTADLKPLDPAQIGVSLGGGNANKHEEVRGIRDWFKPYPMPPLGDSPSEQSTVEELKEVNRGLFSWIKFDPYKHLPKIMPPLGDSPSEQSTVEELKEVNRGLFSWIKFDPYKHLPKVMPPLGDAPSGPAPAVEQRALITIDPWKWLRPYVPHLG